MIQVKRRRAVLNVLFWIRESWYAVAGHFGGATKVALPRPRSGVLAGLEKDKEELIRMRCRHRADWAKYVEWKEVEPNLAEKHLSKLLNRSPELKFQFVCPDSGVVMSEPETVDAILQHFLAKGRDTHVTDTEPSLELARDISAIRRSNATLDPHTGAVIKPQDDKLYTMDELDNILKQISGSKYALRGSLASLKHSGPGGRLLLLGLNNCQLAWQIAANLTTMRGLNPVRKGTSNLITSSKALRPVCQATDMAAVTDCLYLSRHKNKIMQYWGNNQYGGRFESLAPVVSVVLLGQLRIQAGLPLWLNFGDEEGGFDVVPKNDIRLGAFLAGVCGRSWMLLDDILSQDAVCIALMGLVSAFHSPEAGVGQGRRRSLSDFNLAARPLHDLVTSAGPGAAMPSSALPSRLLRAASQRTPPTNHLHDLAFCAAVLPQLVESFERSLHQAVVFLATVPSAADRLALVDGITGVKISILQYVDDNAVPTSSCPQACLFWNTCEQYTRQRGPRFNLAAHKSACMPVGETQLPGPEELPRYLRARPPVVSSYKYLGFLLDHGFTFQRHFEQAMAIFDKAFFKLRSALASLHLPWIVCPATVPPRVESVALNGLGLCINVPGAENALNRMQASWAKYILDISEHPYGNWPALVAEVGWPWRLGTRMLADAILLEARISLLPLDIPAYQALRLAQGSALPSWASHVHQLRKRLGDLPDIVSWLGTIPNSLRSNATLRKSAVRSYRLQVVYPALASYDLSALSNGAQGHWPYARFQRGFAIPGSGLLLAIWHDEDWAKLKIWSVTRVLGRWPLALFGIDWMPVSLERCPYCGSGNADVLHILTLCPDTASLRRLFDIPPKHPWEVMEFLFNSSVVNSTGEGPAPCVLFVATAFQDVATKLVSDGEVDDTPRSRVGCSQAGRGSSASAT